MTKLVCAIDQGTSGSTAILLDSSLNIIAKGYQEFPQIFPKPGWVEHDPNDLWNSTLSAIRQATDSAYKSHGYGSESIVALGITNQRETTLLWDRKTSQPLHNAIVWQDRRTAGRLRQLRDEGMEPLIEKRTGLLLDPYFSASKLEWILNHHSLYSRAQSGELAFGTVESYLIWRLTGGKIHVSDLSNASRTMLLDIHRGTWDEELCSIFHIPTPILPRVIPNAMKIGEVYGVDGLEDGTPIHAAIGDQQSALFGQACFEPGDAKCTHGTGAFLLLNTGEEAVMSSSRMLTTVAWQLPGQSLQYALEGSAFVAGSLIDWLSNELKFFENPAEVEALAQTVASSDGVLCLPAFAGLGAPHWNPDARGTIRGLTRGTTRAHIARAALEGIALQNVDILSAMEKDFGGKISELKVDGGAAKNNLLMQLQADLFDRTIVRPPNVETTAFGAALLAGLSAGIFKNINEIRKLWKPERTFQPQISPSKRAAHLRLWNEAIQSI